MYRARDTRLDRIVAIKILPDHHASRQEFRERFEREARTIASLNHPHICVLHDIGHQDGTDYLVMEYIEGETLAQHLQKGALALDQVLRYAIEIADALDKAHRKGITHRDLKPGNIMLTKSGAKLLDFGLAKLTQPDAPVAAAPLSQLPTAKDAITAQGVILGTLQYMAPEQVEGKEVDARTDIFAFGVVVYEMATGKKAFEGKTSASVMAKILETDPPPMSSLAPMTPPALDRVVKRCLTKDPDDRWQTARDLEQELKWIADGGSQTGAAGVNGSPGASARKGRTLQLVGGAVLLSVALTGLAVWFLKPNPSPPPKLVSRFSIVPPASQRLAMVDSSTLAISPDGRRIVYSALQGGSRQLYLRALDRLDAEAILGTEGGYEPFFSPDGQWIGFLVSGELKKVPLKAAPPESLAPGDSGIGNLIWTDQGTILGGRSFLAP